MKIESHILAPGGVCSRCGLLMQGMPIAPNCLPLGFGDRIGVISGLNFSIDSAYLIRDPKFDSNAICEPNPNKMQVVETV